MSILERLSLKRGVAMLEDGIITLSGPALAISGIIAGVDLVTGGNALKSISWLAVAWAITLLLTLDFQVLALGVRAHRAYISTKPGLQKALEIVLLCLVAGGISYVSIQMQSIVARANAESLPIDQAAMQLGINTIALIWERSTLVLVLIFMSGWLREHDSLDAKTKDPAPVSPATISDETMQHILARLAKLDGLEQALAGLTVISEQLTEHPLLPPGNEIKGLPQAQIGTDALNKPIWGYTENGVNEPVRLEGGLGGPFSDYGDSIEALLKHQPGLAPTEVANIVGCSLTTAKKWMKRLEVPRQEVKR